MDGLLRCSRYAFGPNRLHYCGPDASQEVLAYINNNAQDPGLERLLSAFRTLYPYLQLIAHANKIRDPFDPRVVDAYWIGNSLLDRVGKQDLYRHLIEEKELHKKIDSKSFGQVETSISKNALPHHSFHVMDVWRRTGHLNNLDLIEKMDSCRISSGKVVELHGPFVTVETRPLVYEDKHLRLGEKVKKKVTRSFEADLSIEELKLGDLVSMHWGMICEVITQEQADRLKKYTEHHLKLANKTL